MLSCGAWPVSTSRIAPVARMVSSASRRPSRHLDSHPARGGRHHEQMLASGSEQRRDRVRTRAMDTRAYTHASAVRDTIGRQVCWTICDWLHTIHASCVGHWQDPDGVQAISPLTIPIATVCGGGPVQPRLSVAGMRPARLIAAGATDELYSLDDQIAGFHHEHMFSSRGGGGICTRDSKC